MTAPTDEVDWAAVERRARRLNWWGIRLVPMWFAAILLLTGDLGFWDGRDAWIALTVYAALFLALVAATQWVPAWRRRAAAGSRQLYALRHHVDPGPGLRAKTDTLARRVVASRWVVWTAPFVLLALLPGGEWDHPARAVPGAVVLVGLIATYVVFMRGRVRAAQRWLADPPGPAREPEPPTRLERWTTGRRLVLLGVGLVVLGVLGGLVAALLD